MSKKKKKKMTFSKYLSIFLVLVTIIMGGLIYFIDVLPLEYFIVVVILLVIFCSIIIGLVNSSSSFKKVCGATLSIILIVLFILGINYLLNTLDFFKQFGFNLYKSENYNIYVLNDSKYNKLSDINNTYIGHLDTKNHLGVGKVIDKLNNHIEFRSKVCDDINDLVTNLEKELVSAIILEDAQYDILKEENSIVNKLRIIDNIKIEMKNNNVGTKVDVLNDSYNVYISGADSYGNINNVSRSDVNIVATINPKTNKVLLTNIPRDYYVMLPSFNSYDKITHSGIYGIEESIKAIENLLDIKINYYVKVNFTTLTELIDVLGGISVNSKYEFTTIDGYEFVKGNNILNGKKALSFARERKAFSNGDRIRGENQQLILEAIIDKLISPNIIIKYPEILSSLKNKFITNVSNKELTSIIKKQIDNNDKWSFINVSLTGSDEYDYTYTYKKKKLYVMKPNKESVYNVKDKIKSIYN